jgi:hypothetical protein
VRKTVATVLMSLALAALPPSAGVAQVQISPSIGLYVPHGSSLMEAPQQLGESTTFRKKAVGGPVFTTRMAAWLRPHFGLEGSLAYSPALIAVRSGSGTVRDVDQNLFLASARSVFRINPDSIRNNLQFHLASGLGYVKRTGAAWSDTPQVGTPIAFVIAAGAQTRLGYHGPRRLIFRLELEDYISFLDFDSGSQMRPRLYHDLIWSLGVGFPINVR